MKKGHQRGQSTEVPAAGTGSAKAIGSPARAASPAKGGPAPSATNSGSGKSLLDEKKGDVIVPNAPLAISEEEMHTLCVYTIHLIEGENMVAKDLGGTSDPYCKTACRICFRLNG
jgi:hypothetical protein